MMISAKSRYALRVMVDLAQHNSGVIEILQLIEGNLAPVACLCEGGKKCESTAECTTLPFWQGLEAVINDYLEKHTLEDMISQKTHSCES